MLYVQYGIQHVPINIVQILYHVKAHGLVCIWYGYQENPSMQTIENVDFVRLGYFPPAQLESSIIAGCIY